MSTPDQAKKPIIPETHIRFDGETPLEEMAALEWLETDGLGGYASATVCGMHTRRYHGLLMGALNPPLGRFLFLSRLEETLVVGDDAYELATNRYPGTVSPEGYRLLRSFHIDPFPRFVFQAGGVRLEKTVFMMRGRQAVMVRYRALGPDGGGLPAEARGGIVLRARPFFAFRGEHCLAREHGGLRATPLSGTLTLSLEGSAGIPDCVLHHEGWSHHQSAYWYRNFEYDEERERGLDCSEDLFTPGELVRDLAAGTASLLASVERQSRVATSRQYTPSFEKCWEMLRDQERQRREGLLSGFGGAGEAVRRLALSADAFVVERGDGASVIAGYPWFGDWGRDAMISLPGLAVSTGRFDDAGKVLRTFARYCDKGMIPNFISDTGEAAYNSVDAALWFVVAAYAWWRAQAEQAPFPNDLWGTVREIIHYYTVGTRHNIRLHHDGLIAAGSPDTQLTWMDAKVGDTVFTPRHGMAVEINALWYNALRIAAEVARGLGESPGRYRLEAEKTRRAFEKYFWNGEGKYLYDVADEDGGRDASIRPNQIFAVSLPFSALREDQEKAVLECVERHLLTPRGLRSLSPEDGEYRGSYGGGQWERDGAYHQGTVWGWLLGPYALAYLKVHGGSDASKAHVRELLDPMLKHLGEACLGQLSEIFDGDPPHAPRGCFAQAWSTAETLRAMLEVYE